MRLASLEGDVRDSFQQILPIAFGALIAAVVIYVLATSARDKLAAIAREPRVLVVPIIAWAVVAVIAFTIGASAGLALAIGGAAGAVLLLIFVN